MDYRCAVPARAGRNSVAYCAARGDKTDGDLKFETGRSRTDR